MVRQLMAAIAVTGKEILGGEGWRAQIGKILVLVSCSRLRRE